MVGDSLGLRTATGVHSGAGAPSDARAGSAIARRHPDLVGNTNRHGRHESVKTPESIAGCDHLTMGTGLFFPR